MQKATKYKMRKTSESGGHGSNNTKFIRGKFVV